MEIVLYELTFSVFNTIVLKSRLLKSLISADVIEWRIEKGENMSLETFSRNIAQNKNFDIKTGQLQMKFLERTLVRAENVHYLEYRKKSQIVLAKRSRRDIEMLES